MLTNLGQGHGPSHAFQKVLETASDMVVILDRHGIFLGVNEAVRDILGFEPDELKGRHYTAFMWPGFAETTELERQRVMTGKKVVDFENCFRHKEGRKVYISWSAYWSEEESLTYGIGRNITERRSLEDAARENDSKYHALFEQASDAIMITDYEGRLLDVNSSLCRIFGYSRQELESMNITDLLDPEQLKAKPIMFDKLREGMHVFNERTMLTKDGKAIYVEANVKKLSDTRVVAIAHDITERKKMEEDRKRVTLMLNERVKELTTLYRCSEILQRENMKLGEALEEITDLLPTGWQNPGMTSARITYGYIEHKSEGFMQSPFMQQAEFVTSDGQEGCIQIAYLNMASVSPDEPFLEEEWNMVNMIAEMICLHVNRKIESAALQKSEANLKTIFDTTETIYAMTDENLQIISYNDAAVRFLKKELDITNPGDVNLSAYFRNDRKEIVNAVLPSALDGEPVHYEADYPQSDGSVHWYDVRLNAIRNEGDQLIGLLLSLDDVTERKIRQEKDARQIELLKELSFITSHELRHEYVKLHGVVNLMMDIEHTDKEIKDIVNNSREIFDRLDESIVKLNDRINLSKA